MKQRKTIISSPAVFRLLSFLLALLVFSLPLCSCGKTPATPEDSTAGGSDTTVLPEDDFDAEAATVFVTQNGAGQKDGSSPENAATLADGNPVRDDGPRRHDLRRRHAVSDVASVL